VKPQEGQSQLVAMKAVLDQFIRFNQQRALMDPAARKLLTGEAVERWETSDFGQLAAAADIVVLVGPGRGVGRVQWYGQNGQVTDFYFYLKREGSWKIESMRYLSLTGIVEQAMLGLRAKPKRTATEQEQLDNLELTLACDRELRRHFRAQRAKFDQLVQLKRRRRVSPSDGAAIKKLVRELHLDQVMVRGTGDVDFLIGGITDNSVGYLYCPSDRPPTISDSDYIWVEKLAANWYLYRTT
jgi:hypothetical protein